MALSMSRNFTARPVQQPALAGGRAPVRAKALAIRGPGQDDGPSSVAQLLASLIWKPDANDAADSDDIPVEYRRDAQTPHVGGWVHSHIAARLATASKPGGEL